MFSCFKTANEELKKTGFNPIKDIQYSFHSIDDSETELKIYFLIDASHFVYNQNKMNKYLSNIELIFQLLDLETKKEINRKLIELEIVKSNFPQTKKDNYYEGEIAFLIDKKNYLLNTKLIDTRSMSIWNKKETIDIDISKYFSNLSLYYNDKGENKRIKDYLDSEINEFDCSFYYFNQDKNVDNLSLYLINRKDTVHQQDIPITINQNNYNITIELKPNLYGDFKCRISDGETFRETKISIIDKLSQEDFWLNDSELIKTVMRYVLPYKEYKKIKKMDAEEMEYYLKQYWNLLDPNKNTSKNELLIELNNRIKRVNSRFQESKTAGWNTDRGKIYIVNGEPKSIRTENNPQTNNIREIWSYQSGKVYIFEQNSFGRYYMINDGF